MKNRTVILSTALCLAPILLGVSLFTGALTGLISACLFRALAHTGLMKG